MTTKCTPIKQIKLGRSRDIMSRKTLLHFDDIKIIPTGNVSVDYVWSRIEDCDGMNMYSSILIVSGLS